jgi:hypothetical protein
MSKYVYDPRLQGKHSAFNQHLFEKYDIPARDKIKKILGDFVSDNPDIYKQDLLITDNDCRYKYIELQVCSGWIGDTYPYDKVYIYERKCHYGDDTLFLTLNHDMSRGYIFSGKNIKDLQPRRIKKYAREFVYDIPWHRIMPVIIEDLTPDIIKLY